jgi:hypothetical protein
MPEVNETGLQEILSSLVCRLEDSRLQCSKIANRRFRERPNAIHLMERKKS